MSSLNLYTKNHKGFSLIEMAIVMVILGLLLGGMMIPLSEQREVSQRQETERQLQEIRNALIGFAQANGRLPCPSDINAVTPGVAQPTCDPAFFGVPYNTLGLQGTVRNGALVDVWSRPIYYRLTSVPTVSAPIPPWLYARANIPLSGAPQGDLVICNSSVGVTATNCGTSSVQLAANVVAVIFSEGPNHSSSADENQNACPNPPATIPACLDPVFVNHTLTQTFDDIVVWIPQPTLIYELSKAGQ